LLISSFSRQRKVFFKVGIIFVSTTFLIFLLINSGVVKGLVEYVAPLTRLFGLPPSCAIPVSTYMFSPLVGAASIGAMLKDGVLSDLQGDYSVCLRESIDASHIHYQIFFCQIYINLRLFTGLRHHAGFHWLGDVQPWSFSLSVSEYGLEKS